MENSNDDAMSTSTRISAGTMRQQSRPLPQQASLASLAVPSGVHSQASSQPSTVSLSDSNMEAIRAHERVMRMHEIQRKAKNLPIPTNDKEVKLRLREMGQPICLFGEDAGDRRERLRNVIIKYYIEEGKQPVFFHKFVDDSQQDQKDDSKQEEVFYTEGEESLKEARLLIAKYSLPRAQQRVDIQRKKRIDIDRLIEEKENEEYLNSIGNYEVKESEYADDRCVSRGCVSPDESLFATAGWSGVSKVWGIPDCKIRTELRGHTDRVNCIKFHPQSTISLPEDGPNMATASADCSVRLWSLNPEFEFQKNIILKGHDDVVNYVDFHPMGKHIASSSNDKTWRFWDLEYKKEILIQEGHAGEVYPISFQKDGSLLATGDFHGIGLIWDLRSGQNVLSFQGHVKRIISMKFLPNCYQVATGSDDNTVKIWDLRRKTSVYTVPAHTKLISDIKFDDDSNGRIMLTTSYDHKVKLWSTGDWVLVRTLSGGHDNKITSVSVAKNMQYIITTSFDRTFKLWQMKKQTNN